MQSVSESTPVFWKMNPVMWVFIIVIAALLGVTFYAGIREMVYFWNVREEYSYGYMIPFITAFLVWQKKNILEKTEFSGSWAGIAVICFGLALFFVGSLSTITTIVQYAFLIVIIGAVLSITGRDGIKPILIPLLFLAFMIPLPSFFLNNLSSQLQLISSSIGVGVIRLFGISVYLEGNVIDLGSYKLQVVEACSGLRYLFPLMSLSFICAYIFKGAFWKRAVIFLSSIPITVLMNSFRIGVIGVLVEYWGVAQAEGFIHDFEGWVVFMACFGIILCEIWILAKVGSRKQTLRDAFSLDLPDPLPKDAEIRHRNMPKQFLAVGGLLVISAISSFFIATRAEIQPNRSEFSSFPSKFEGWQGNRIFLEKIYLDVLKLDDYILSDYVNDSRAPVNFYAAYYVSQKAGESAHSPRSCIPGGGWQIKEFSQHEVEGVTLGSASLKVNRLIIQKGEVKNLVYYWFQQRGRNITNEYMVKWYLFWDALTRHRTDGAMVRLTTLLMPGEDIAEADKRLAGFIKAVGPSLSRYIPD
jgi:exosortase D (VPLPA-CTERM-specific)